MKKISLLLILVLCFSFASCGNGNGETDPFQGAPFVPSYTISFQTNGGSRVYSQKCSTLLSAPETERDGYEFRGWYRDEGCEVPVVYPLEVKSNITLYAKWLRVRYEAYCEDLSLKYLDDNIGYGAKYLIEPIFDFETLAKEGYEIQIKVTYDVRYKKDYNVLWDIGYLGAPKFEAYIYNSDKKAVADEGITAKKTAQTRTLTYRISAAKFKTTNVFLEFSTNNIQNVIYFENISVVCTCSK